VATGTRVRPPGTPAAAVALAGKDLRRGLKSRSLLLISVVGPLALGLIMATAFGGEGPSATVAVVDLDRSPTSRGIVEGLRRDLGDGAIRVRTPEGDARRLVRTGRVDAALVVPAGYGGSLTGRPEPLVVVRHPDRFVAGEVARAVADGLASQSDVVSAAVATALASGAGPPEQVVADAVDVRAAVEVVSVDLSRDFDAPLYFGPLTIFLFLGLGTAARSLVREQHEGTLDRIRAAPVSVWGVVGGSSLGVLAQGLVAALVVYGVSSLLFGAEWGQPVEVLVVLVAMVVGLSGLAAVIAGLARTEPQAEGWNNALAFIFGILGGAFFGGARFPGVLGAIGSVTPNGLAMQALVEVGPGGRSLVDVLPQLGGLLLTGAVGLAVGGALMKRRLA
jgi:ABC-2 type transport system permease protein